MIARCTGHVRIVASGQPLPDTTLTYAMIYSVDADIRVASTLDSAFYRDRPLCIGA